MSSDMGLSEKQKISGIVEHLYELSDNKDSSVGTVESDDSLDPKLENSEWQRLWLAR